MINIEKSPFYGRYLINIMTNTPNAITDIKIPTRRSNQLLGLAFHFLISERTLKNIPTLPTNIANNIIILHAVITIRFRF